MVADIELILPILLFVIMEGLFSGGELALIASDTHKIRLKAEKGSRSARIAMKLLDRPEWFLSTTLTGTNLCQITNTALATAFFISLFGIEKGEVVSIAVMIPLVLILGEVAPKGIAQHHADFIAPRIAWFIWAASWAFYPAVWILSRISKGVVYAFSKRTGDVYSHYITKSGLESLLKSGEETGDITLSEKEMIQQVLDFSDYTVDRIMVPLSTVTLVPVTATLGEACRIIRKKKYSKIPVYREDIFNIIGIIDVFDLMRDLTVKGSKATLINEAGEGSIKEQILYVPETQRASDLFFELQQTGEHMAIIVDEYGGAIGIVTMEDILEEIVGEIDDEYKTGHEYKKVGRGQYLLKGQMKIDHIRKLLPVTIPQGDYETLAGFLLNAMGKIPKPRESFKVGDSLFVIDDADARSVKQVLVVIPPERERTIQKESQ